MVKIILLAVLLSLGFILFVISKGGNPKDLIQSSISIPSAKPSPVNKINLQTPTQSKILPNDYHIFQSFNNCGPAALSMALSYYGISETQQKLGEDLRPYQIPGGDNDDKSVTLEELAEKAKDYDLIPYHRPNGNIELIKLFITYDIPIITRTWLKANDDIGHYRVVKGYDEDTKQIIQDDSLQGKNLKYYYQDFSELWKKFNYEYLVLVPKEKKEIVETILGVDLDIKQSWKKAVDNTEDPFNLSIALYNIGEYQKAVEEFEKVENQLSFRTLWYQIEPIQAYYELGNYEKVFQITDKILNNHNKAFSELYFLRGQIYLKQNSKQLAKEEFEKAVFYNKNFKPASTALNSLL